MIRIGLTGIIGSGKTTAISFFSSLGVPVFIADESAKNIMANDKIIRSEISSILGSESYVGEKLNKKYISDKIFNDKDLLKSINELVHPKVKNEYISWLKKQSFNYSVYEAALIFENKSESDFDKIICIKTPVNEIHKRLRSRKNYSKSKIDNIISSQIDQDVKCLRSDYCIDNLSIKELENQLFKIHSLYV